MAVATATADLLTYNITYIIFAIFDNDNPSREGNI